LAFYARTDANDLFDEKSDEIFAALAEQLAELVAAASVTVDALGPVNTAADAIEGGMTDAWKVIQNQLKVYREIRRAQSALYACLKWPFDRRAFGDSGSPNTQADSDARIYYHRRLPEVAPGWDDQRTTDAFGRDTPPRSIPWPDDAAERFIWCIRNDSGIWCPSPSELNALTNAIPERRTNGVERVNRVKRQYSEKTLAHRGAVDDSAHGFTSPGPAELISTPAIWVPPETET
jgi:hypothetical protein